jgi:lysozyme
MLRGIDVSHYQGTIDWSRVKTAGIRFAYIKATQGASFVDPLVEKNVYGCAAAGIPFGLYHVFLANTGAAQLDNWKKTQARMGGGDLPAWLDIEPGSVTEETAAEALTMLQKGFTVADCVYASPSTIQAYLGDPGFLKYGLAIAQYTDAAAPNIHPWPDWTFWQINSTGRVDGVLTQVDTDYFNGDDAALAALIQRANGLKSQPASTVEGSAKT